MAANSGESIEAAVELINSHKLSDSLTIQWFNNLANAKNPTKEAVVKASVNPFKYFHSALACYCKKNLNDKNVIIIYRAYSMTEL